MSLGVLFRILSLGVLFRIREYLQGSLWSFPLIGAILGPLAANLDSRETVPSL